jgi:hypothetical protein
VYIIISVWRVTNHVFTYQLLFAYCPWSAFTPSILLLSVSVDDKMWIIRRQSFIQVAAVVVSSSKLLTKIWESRHYSAARKRVKQTGCNINVMCKYEVNSLVILETFSKTLICNSLLNMADRPRHLNCIHLPEKLQILTQHSRKR